MPGVQIYFIFIFNRSWKDYRGTLSAGKAKLSRFAALMHNRNIQIIGRGLWYISTAHTVDEIDHIIQTASELFNVLQKFHKQVY